MYLREIDMKLKLRAAYTLPEVLTTLAIIGVVAAVTIPQVAVSIQKKQDGAMLGRTMQIMEGGCQNMVMDVVSSDKIMTSPHLGHSDIGIFEALHSDGTVWPDGINPKNIMQGDFLLRFNPFYGLKRLPDTDATSYKN